MSSNQDSLEDCTPESFRSALSYLYDEALAAGWEFPAHFIAVAVEAMGSFCDRNDGAAGKVVKLNRKPGATSRRGAGTRPNPC